MNRPFLFAGLIGVTVVAMSIVLLCVFPSRLPAMPRGFVTPIIAFEFVRTVDDVQLIFGPENSPQRLEIINAMDLGNKLDYIYMVLYAAFLAVFSLTCVRVGRNRLFYIPACIAALVLAADALENVQLLAITANLESMDIETYLTRLHGLTWVKWAGLAVIFLFLVPYFINGGLFPKIIAVAAVVCALLAAGAFVHRSVLNELFGAMTAIIFLLIIIYSFVYRTPPHHNGDTGMA